MGTVSFHLNMSSPSNLFQAAARLSVLINNAEKHDFPEKDFFPACAFRTIKMGRQDKTIPIFGTTERTPARSGWRVAEMTHHQTDGVSDREAGTPPRARYTQASPDVNNAR